jgi:hypothetical protein
MLISFLLSLLQNLDRKLSNVTIYNVFDVLAIMRSFKKAGSQIGSLTPAH